MYFINPFKGTKKKSEFNIYLGCWCSLSQALCLHPVTGCLTGNPSILLNSPILFVPPVILLTSIPPISAQWTPRCAVWCVWTSSILESLVLKILSCFNVMAKILQYSHYCDINPDWLKCRPWITLKVFILQYWQACCTLSHILHGYLPKEIQWLLFLAI